MQLTPEQAKYWPAAEEAIRIRAIGREIPLAPLARLRDQGDKDPIDIVRHRADALAQRARSSNNLPTHGSRFTPPSHQEQKQRLHFFAVNILRIVPKAAELRRMQAEGEGDED